MLNLLFRVLFLSNFYLNTALLGKRGTFLTQHYGKIEMVVLKGSPVASIAFVLVKFSCGNATKSWSDGTR